MRPLWKDILAALWLGVLLPGIVLNAAVLTTRQSLPMREVEEIVDEPVLTQDILLLQEDGTKTWLDANTYLTGVVLAEMPSSFEPEALKAQTVAAGTYARKAGITGGKHGDGSVCTNPACCQGFLSESDYLSQGGTPESLEKVTKAVSSVSSFMLVHDGEPIEAVYFSCSGGATEAAWEVWGADYPYLQSVSSPGEEEAAYHTDSVLFTLEEFQQKLGRDLPEDPSVWFGAVEYTAGGGVSSIEIAEETYTGVQIRSLMNLRSTAFEMSVEGNSILVRTKGYGHRVGMSQYGANAMAQQGSTYINILRHYYPGAVVVPSE